MIKLNSRGVAHFAALAIIVLGVASYGTYKLVASHAATLNSASCQASNVELSAASHSTGPCVTFVQQKIGATPDGDFGPLTASKVVAFQKAHNIGPDGIVGPCTWAAVNGTTVPTTCLVIKPAPVAAKPVTLAPKPVAVAPTPVVVAPKPVTSAPAVCQPATRPYLSASSNSQHACVEYIQRIVGTTPDGDFGPATASKVEIYQGQHGLTQDGTVGPCTWTAILGGATTAACKASTQQASTSQPTATTTYTGNGQTTTTTPTTPAKPTATTTYTGNGQTTTTTSPTPSKSTLTTPAAPKSSPSPSSSTVSYPVGSFCYTDYLGVQHTNYRTAQACAIAKAADARVASVTVNCRYFDHEGRVYVTSKITNSKCHDFSGQTTTASVSKPKAKPAKVSGFDRLNAEWDKLAKELRR